MPRAYTVFVFKCGPESHLLVNILQLKSLVHLPLLFGNVLTLSLKFVFLATAVLSEFSQKTDCNEIVFSLPFLYYCSKGLLTFRFMV